MTVFDNSPAQLAQDRLVAEREGLALETVQGDMADLGRFADGAFGLIFHPCSNCFAPEIRGVWRECFRVLRPGGVLLAGFSNPVRFLFPAERTDGMDLRFDIEFRLRTSAIWKRSICRSSLTIMSRSRLVTRSMIRLADSWMRGLC